MLYCTIRIAGNILGRFCQRRVLWDGSCSNDPWADIHKRLHVQTGRRKETDHRKRMNLEKSGADPVRDSSEDGSCDMSQEPSLYETVP